MTTTRGNDSTKSTPDRRLRAMLLATAVALGVTLGACGGDDAADTTTTGDAGGTTSTSPAPTTGADAGTGTTTGAPDVNTTTAPPPTATDVRAQLAEKFDRMGGMDRVNIEADAAGVVTLSGTVTSPDRKQTAEDAAAMVPGVVRVKNDIVVRQ